MRITPEVLFKLANDFINRRARSDRDLLAVYLHGSLLKDVPVLGGTTDIDLFFVHSDEVSAKREIVRITDEIHLDISHYARKQYHQTRALRLHPWMGPSIAGCKILYDPQHFMDFTQASVRGQFNRPDYVVSRARSQVEHARQIWMEYQLEPQAPGPTDISSYLRAVEHAANAVAVLSGPPLTERRFLINFPERADAVGRPGLFPGLLGLLGGPRVDADALRAWLPEWRAAYEAFPAEQAPPRLHPFRLPYYLKAFEAILDSERHQMVLWPLLRTWTHAVCVLPEGTGQLAAWEEAARNLGLLGEAFFERIAALDAYLDLVEETLEDWGREYGA